MKQDNIKKYDSALALQAVLTVMPAVGLFMLLGYVSGGDFKNFWII